MPNPSYRLDYTRKIRQVTVSFTNSLQVLHYRSWSPTLCLVILINEGPRLSGQHSSTAVLLKVVVRGPAPVREALVADPRRADGIKRKSLVEGIVFHYENY